MLIHPSGFSVHHSFISLPLLHSIPFIFIFFCLFYSHLSSSFLLFFFPMYIFVLLFIHSPFLSCFPSVFSLFSSFSSFPFPQPFHFLSSAFSVRTFVLFLLFILSPFSSIIFFSYLSSFPCHILLFQSCSSSPFSFPFFSLFFLFVLLPYSFILFVSPLFFLPHFPVLYSPTLFLFSPAFSGHPFVFSLRSIHLPYSFLSPLLYVLFFSFYFLFSYLIPFFLSFLFLLFQLLILSPYSFLYFLHVLFSSSSCFLFSHTIPLLSPFSSSSISVSSPLSLSSRGHVALSTICRYTC